MRLLLQRVLSAEVSFEGKLQGSCNKGLLIYLCVMKGDKKLMYGRLLRGLKIGEDESPWWPSPPQMSLQDASALK